jgi:hypothetical protein
MHRTTALLATLTTLALGCGGEVITPSQSSSATSGNGGAASSATASGAGGMTSSVASTSAGPEPAVCDDPTVFVDILGDGANQHFDASCAPIATLTLPGGAKLPPPGPPSQGSTLAVVACSAASNPVLLVYGQSLSWPGSISTAQIMYYHEGAEYDQAPTASGSLEVFTFEDVGGVVTGTFTATLVPKDPAGIPAQIKITGKFRVCRGPDVVPV